MRIKKELCYNYEIDGEVITDIYADKIIGREVWNDAKRENCSYAVYCGKENQEFDWENDDFPEIPKREMVMYKLHVRGFSMDGGAKGKKRGTFAAIADKIDYLKGMGVTTVEFMPIYEFEEVSLKETPGIPDYIKWQASEQDVIIPEDGGIKAVGLNYWGYGSGNYFAVKTSYAFVPKKANAEFKQLVKTLHENGMECVLEFFFPEDTNHNMIMDVLHYWVKEYHVDGFHVMGASLPITSIVQDPILSRTKIFMEDFYGQCDSRRKYKNLYIYKEEYQYAARQLLNHYDCDIRAFANQQIKQGENYGYVNFIASNNGFTNLK